MSEPRLRVSALTVRLGRTFVMGPLTVEAEHGVVHLAGANGSGKTTALRAMCGELGAHTGHVHVEGLDVHRKKHARRRIALVPATPELPAFLTVREAWQFTASLRGAPQWSGETYCESLALPPTLPLAHASAGQRRKAELVCGLAGEPSVLLLDETFAHLDSASAQQLAEWIAQWALTRVVVLTHHGEPPVRVAQTVPVPASSTP